MFLLSVSLPIFLIIFSGWLFRKFKIANEEWVFVLNFFAYYVALPMLVISSFLSIDFKDLFIWNEVLKILLIILLFSFLVIIVLVPFKISRNIKASIFLAATVGNTVYMGFPIIELAFGKDVLKLGALYGIIYLIFPLLISIFVLRYFVNSEQRLLEQLKEFFKNPLTISFLAGIVLSLLKFDNVIFNAIEKTISMLGQTASPLALFVLGVFLYDKFLKENFKFVLIISLLKMVVFPILTIVCFLSFFNFYDFKISIMLSSMPTAVTTFVVAQKFNLDKAIVGSAIFISTIVAFFIIPLLLYFLSSG